MTQRMHGQSDNRPFATLLASLRLPIFVAPMFLISGPDLVVAAARAGLIAAFPAANARTLEDLGEWLERITSALKTIGRRDQWAVNIIVHPTYDRLEAELDLIAMHRPPIVIAALGSPRRALDRVHGFGGALFSDVISPDQARKAVDAGADGLVLVAAGAGGHTGRYSPFALVEEVRSFWAGPVVLGGAIGGGRAIRAATALGADLAYMGTRFIAAEESLVSDDYREMLVRARMTDIVTTAAVTGVPANWMRESLERAGVTGAMLGAAGKVDFADIQGDAKAWKHIWGAGHAVAATTRLQRLEEIVADIEAELAALML